MSTTLTRLQRAEARLGKRQRTEPSEAERDAFDWYADSCPCGLEPGTCSIHHRARPDQREPDGEWSVWLNLGGRAAGKTRTGAEWVSHAARSGMARRIALVGATAADSRDVMVEGLSGILAVSPPWDTPVYEPSKRRLTWKNGARATIYSADEPRRLRGPNHDLGWADELAAWEYPEAWDMLLMGLRVGDRPRVITTTTPKPSKLIKSLIADPTAVVVKASTYANRSHLAGSFFDKIIARYEGTRLGAQELLAEILEVNEAAWFARFDVARHVTDRAEYIHGLPTILSIDAGTSMTTAAVWWQAQQIDRYRHRLNVFADYCKAGSYSEANAKAIFAKCMELPCRGQIANVWIDPAADARSGLGPAAFSEYQRLFGHALSRSPYGLVVDGLDQIELLLETDCLIIHPRCADLKSAFLNYRRQQRGGEFLNKPVEGQSPAEDLVDALRYGIRARFPEGRPRDSGLRTGHASKFT